MRAKTDAVMKLADHYVYVADAVKRLAHAKCTVSEAHKKYSEAEADLAALVQGMRDLESEVGAEPACSDSLYRKFHPVHAIHTNGV
jgi:hypothetical protein